ncbi:maleylacetoacetate isomerase [Enterobacteriaceae bacterium 4M9]|nr:maleylacetoacetate isomerase [Enterobacteriaceae bacterium 4M9]
MNAPASTRGSDVVLYDYWRSSASFRVRIALELKNISWQRVAVDLAAGVQHSPQHRLLNPLERVPVLAIDGLLLTQSLAIIDYLEETRLAVPLLPTSAAARARVRALAQIVACDIHPLSNLSTLDRVEALAGSDARAQWNHDNIAAGLRAFEQMLNHADFRGSFCSGDTPGLADCALIPQLYNARRWGVRLDDLGRISSVEKACAEVAAFQRASPEAVEFTAAD